MKGATDVLTGVVESLRTDQDVLDALYVDSTVPFEPSDRDRVYVGAASRRTHEPVEVAVMVIAAGSVTSKSVVERTFGIECTVLAQEFWYEEYQTLAFTRIFDALAETNVLAPAEYYNPSGIAGASDGIEVDEDTGERRLAATWQFSVGETRW